MSVFKEEFMQAAFDLAKDALSVAEVPVGCVFVHDNSTIIGRGRNRTNETRNVH